MSDVSIIFISILVIFGVVECIIPIIFTRWREAEYGVVAGMIAGGVVEVLLLLLTFVAFLCHMPEAKITGWALLINLPYFLSYIGILAKL